MTTPPHAKASPWWSKAIHEDRRGLLLARNRVTGALRADFAAHDFVEVEPAVADQLVDKTKLLKVGPAAVPHALAFRI